MRVNGTLTTNGEINTNGHSIDVGDIECDSINAGSNTIYCGDVNCGAINGNTTHIGDTYVSSLSVSGTTSLTGNVTSSGTLNGKDASFSASVTVNGTARTNGELKTANVYPTDDNQRSIGKSDHRYKNGYIINTNTDKVILSSSVTMQYNSTDDCIDFIFN